MNKRTTPLIVGNWKATPKTLQDAVTFIQQLEKKLSTKTFLAKAKLPKKAYYLSVPEIFIPVLEERAVSGYIGSQTVHGTILGQRTGGTTPTQLKSAGAAFTLIGHSEIRKKGETQVMRKEKIELSLTARLTTIFCLGEHTRDKEGKYLEELENDVKQTLAQVKRELFANLIIAYEPIWAIGAPVPATALECFEAVIAIRRALASLGGIEYAKKVKVLYGGSVTVDTVTEFLEEGGVDGLLIGRASQEVASFVGILERVFKK